MNLILLLIRHPQILIFFKICFAFFSCKKRKIISSLDIYIWRFWPYVRAGTSTKPKRAEHLKMRKSQFSSLEMSGEGREHTLSTATAFEKGLFHTKNCFCTCYCSVWCFCCAALPDWQNCFLPKQILTLIATFYISYICDYATHKTGWKIDIIENFEVINFRLSKKQVFFTKNDSKENWKIW